MDATIKANNSELVIRLDNGCSINQSRHGPYELWLPGGTMYAHYQGNHALRMALAEGMKFSSGEKVTL